MLQKFIKSIYSYPQVLNHPLNIQAIIFGIKVPIRSYVLIPNLCKDFVVVAYNIQHKSEVANGFESGFLNNCFSTTRDFIGIDKED